MANNCGTIEVTLKGDPAKVLESVKKEAAKNDIDVKGDAKSGTIKHRKVDVSGTYAINGQKVKVSMSEDTMFADCKKINDGVKAWFAGK